MGLDIWNPWHGCHKISPGCQNCYMYYLDEYRGRPEWSDKVFKTGKFKLPLKKYKTGGYKLKSGQIIRVNMTSDTFIEDAEPWLPEFWQIIAKRPDVIFWILTKRPERIEKSLPPDWNDGYDNVSLNITTENQAMFNARWPVFQFVPAKHKGICCAPLLGPIDITPALISAQIDEVSVGGENYDKPRPCDFNWVASLSQQCACYRTNFCWYESGTRFVYQNRELMWPRKADQAAIAYFSRQNLIFKQPEYILKSPSDGHVLTPDERYKPVYNLNHCTFCSRRMQCNGCLNCGDCCQPPALSDLATLHLAEDFILKTNPPLTYQIYIQNSRNLFKI